MIELNVKGMVCGGCASSVEKAIKRVDSNANHATNHQALLPFSSAEAKTDNGFPRVFR